jgi:hypothetical protein
MSGLAMVGEHGPELVNLPGGSKVFSNRDSRSMMGGMGGGAINITGNTFNVRDDSDPIKIARQLYLLIDEENRRKGIRSTAGATA